MSDIDPPRLIEGSDSELLRKAIAGARADTPQASSIEAMLARFPTGGGGGGPSGPTHPTHPSAPPAPLPGVGSLSIAKAVGAMLLLGGVGAGAYFGLHTDPKPAPPAPSVSVAMAVAPSSSALPAASESAAVMPSAAPLASSIAPTPLVVKPTESALEPDSRTEMDILREAQAALASNPGRALALANEDQNRFPRGSLGQERDMIRIQALLAEGHSDEARALASDFKRRHPDSAHNSRLDALFP